MRKWALAAAVFLIATACGDSGSATTTGPEPVVGATAGPPTTTTTTAPDTPAETEAPPETTRPTPTTTMPVGEARFAITQVTFGDNGFVQITNTGEGPGDLAGHWLCQRPNYFMLDPAELDPGEAVWVAVGDGAALDVSTSPSVMDLVAAEGALGGFAASGGEVALYASRDFESADAIRDFVAWSSPGGLPGLGRAGVAVAAEIWVSSGLVEVPAEGISITATVLPTTSPDAWIADLGG